MIIDPSPTNFNPDRMPKTIASNIYTCTSKRAYANRVKIHRLLANGDKKVKELEEIQADGESSDDDYSEELRKELGEDMAEIKASLKEHSELSYQMGLMCNYIMDVKPGVESCKKEAKEELEKSLKDEQNVEDKVDTWRRTNRSWLRKKTRAKEKWEPAKSDNPNGNRTRWLENFAKDLKPASNLKDDGDLTVMKQWKMQMQTYTSYIRKEFEVSPELYYHVFANLCEPELRKKLDMVKGIKEMGEAGIWAIIEGIWIESNPMFMRRLKAMDMKMEAGEEVGDF